MRAMMRDYRINPVTCPACGRHHNAAANTAGGRGPRDGDPTICISCRALLVYTGTPPTALRHPTDTEELEFLADPHLQRVIQILRQANES